MGSFCILGAGYIGQALANALRPRHRVLLVRRHWDECPPDGLACDLRDLRADDMPDDCDAVFWTASPDGATPQAYERLYVETLKHVLRQCEDMTKPPHRFFLTASTAVYHQKNGEVVTEESPTEPTRMNGQLLLEAEAILRQSGLTTTSLRLGGIYGPGRYGLLQKVLQQQPCLTTAPIVSNMIHRDDVVGAMMWLAGLQQPADTYNVVDCQPAPRNDVLAWLSESVGVPLNEARLDPESMRHGSNKYCSNQRLRKTGYHFLYPNYQSGFSEPLANQKVNK